MTPQTPLQGTNLGIEVTAAMLRVVVISDGNRVDMRREFPVEPGTALLPRLVTIINELKSETSARSVGIAIAGLINRRDNRVILSTQLPSLAATDIAAELTNQTGANIWLENDANAAAFGEYMLGAGRGSRSMFFATIGTGIGGAIVLDGKLWRGATGFAGEFGHIAINEDGVKLEDVASTANIIRRTRERLFQDSTSSLGRKRIEQAGSIDDIVQAAKNGDDFAHLMLERTGTYIGTAIASVINLLNVERVVLGGEVMEAGRMILESIVRRTRERSFPPSFEATSIATVELKADAPAIGAALLAGQAAG